MAFTVKLYSFNKRENSTKVPTVSDASTDVSVLLKEGSDIVNPVLILNDAVASYASKNYAYISEFARYYFINKIEYDTGNRILLYLSCDVLGTYATTIKALTGVFVEYCSQPSNMIEDSRLMALSAPNYSVTNNSLQNTIFTETACAILSSTGDNCSGLFILQYGLDDAETLLDGVDWDAVTIPSPTDDKDAIVKLGNAIVDTAQQFFTKDAASKNIRSCFGLPWVVHGDAIGEQIDDLIIGSFPTGKTAYRVANEIVTDSCVIDIPWTYSNWQRSSKYTDLLIYLPLFGIQKLPTDQLQNDSQIRVTYAFSYDNGDVSYQIQGMTSNVIVSTGTTNASAPLAIGTSNTNNTKLASSTAISLGTVGAAAAGLISGVGALAAGAAAIGTSFLNTMDALAGSALPGGGYGGFACAALDPVIHLYRFTKAMSDSPTSMGSAYGYPTCAVRSLSGLSGYCKLRYFSFNMGTLEEKKKVDSYLNGGFWIE